MPTYYPRQSKGSLSFDDAETFGRSESKMKTVLTEFIKYEKMKCPDLCQTLGESDTLTFERNANLLKMSKLQEGKQGQEQRACVWFT